MLQLFHPLTTPAARPSSRDVARSTQVVINTDSHSCQFHVQTRARGHGPGSGMIHLLTTRRHTGRITWRRATNDTHGARPFRGRPGRVRRAPYPAIAGMMAICQYPPPGRRALWSHLCAVDTVVTEPRHATEQRGDRHNTSGVTGRIATSASAFSARPFQYRLSACNTPTDSWIVNSAFSARSFQYLASLRATSN